MEWLILTLAALAIPIFIVAKIVRRVREVSSRLGDPTRLQRAFAQSAAAALRRAGADPKAIAKLEVLGHGAADGRGADLQAALYEARIGMRKPEPPAPVSPHAPIGLQAPPLRRLERPRAVGHALHRPPRPRPHQQPLAPPGGFDLGDRFRLAEPPDLSEPQGPMSFGGSWVAIAALLAGAAYYFLR